MKPLKNNLRSKIQISIEKRVKSYLRTLLMPILVIIIFTTNVISVFIVIFLDVLSSVSIGKS
jgi:hypothetical protein